MLGSCSDCSHTAQVTSGTVTASSHKAPLGFCLHSVWRYDVKQQPMITVVLLTPTNIMLTRFLGHRASQASAQNMGGVITGCC